jgi:hypothetical protein
MRSALRLRVVGAAIATVAVLVLFVPGADTALAVNPAADLTIESFAAPTNFSAKDNAGCLVTAGNIAPSCDAYDVTVTNVGSVPTDGSEIRLSDALPAGLEVARVSFFWTGSQSDLGEGLCTSTTGSARCRFPIALAPDATLKMSVYVTVEAGAPDVLMNRASVSGGGAAGASVEQRNTISSTSAAFGPSSFAFRIAGVNGAPDTQASDHPYELTTTIGLNNAFRPEVGPWGTSAQDVKDVVVDLPLGFVGSTLAAPECPLAQLSTQEECPADTIIGHIVTEPGANTAVDSPIYNMVPEHGFPAEFGYVDGIRGSHLFYARVVPTSAGYVLQTTNPDIPQVPLAHIEVTFYGDPAAKQEELALREGKVASALPHVPFFTDPSDCSGEPLVATIYMDSWQNPARFNADGTPVDLGESAWVKATSVSPPMTGCDALQFPAELLAQPTTHEADTPSGLEFGLKVPQSETVGVPATPTVKKIVVKFPEGFTVDPSAGDGLAACSEAQIGWLGGSHLNFSPAQPECPEASKIGSLELETPLIPHKLEGEMFLASQNENPFGATLAAYVVVNDPVTGVLVKIAGEVLPDPHTGQLTAVFDENPNLPFSDLRMHFFGGPRAEFATPESCSTFTTESELFPYSFPDSGLQTLASDSFGISEACPGGFSPSFTALSTNVQAGAFTPFVASFSRSDTDQELAGLTVTLPPGLVADLTGVPLCSDADAAAGSCPESTQVGTVLTSTGPGPNPLQVAGKAYLTGPYNGGPYGLAVVVPAVAGPFNFGTVVVRQSIRINPTTAQVTDVSDPFPTIIDGIPLRLRGVQLTLNRPGFSFNPTNCSKLGFTGSVSGTPLGAPTTLNGTVGYATQPGASSSFATPFQVTDCAGLGFAPKLSASISAQSSKAYGTNLTVRLAYPSAPFGSQANISRVKVDLPKQLPSRLTTLQQACTAAQFNSNPADCPSGSIVGHAVVHTPILPAPLEGPAYFVSHGGEEFPNLTIVLQGNGVTVKLVGDTFIDNKTGVTSSTFNTVPDVPVETFELTLPTGPYSALAADLPIKANYNFCGQTLAMPTAFYAQNGAEIHDSTPIAINGCKKSKQTRAQKLAAALKACHKKPKSKRAQCAATARKHYGTAKNANRRVRKTT